MIGEIKYGDVVLSLTKVNDVNKEIVYSNDGMDYLYTAWTIDVTVTFNPMATAYTMKELGGYETPNRAKGGHFAARTDRAIEDYLAQPRRKLTMWCYDKNLTKCVYLESPNKNMVCDAKGGPFCKVIAIREVHGCARG